MTNTESSHRERSAPLMRTEEVADYLGVSARTVKRYARDGLIEPIRLSARTVRYTPEAVRDLLAATSGE